MDIMFYYSITIQFAKADAPKFTEITKLINDAIEVYNAKSLMAANPKQIVEKNIRDNMTLEVILESTQELQESMASKALRVFSSYLIDEGVENNLSSYITGKRLFKMIPSKLEGYLGNPRDEDNSAKENRAIYAKQVNYLNEQLKDFNSLESVDEKLNAIYEKLLKLENERA